MLCFGPRGDRRYSVVLYTHKHGRLFGLKILNFDFYGVFRKMNIFGGMIIFMDFFYRSPVYWTFWGHFRFFFRLRFRMEILLGVC